MAITEKARHRSHTFLLFMSIWTTIAIVAATTTFIGIGGRSASDWFAVFTVMAEYFYTWGAISIGVYWLLRRRRGAWSGFAVQIPLHLLLLVGISALMPIWVHGESWPSWLYGERAVGFHSLNAFVYSVILMGAVTLRTWRENRDQQQQVANAKLREIDLQRSLEVTRMEALRSQINPHFLFNTLNSVASLIESSSNREAYAVIESLASLLRRGLDYSRDSLATLADEMRFLDAYIAIERARFPDRLKITTSIPEDCLPLDVPSFSLQPLVENAVKHAVSQTKRPVTIDIRVSRTAQRLRVLVVDDGPGISTAPKPGVGLSNLQTRLQHLFGDQASLSIRANEPHGACVELTVPVGMSVVTESEPPDSFSRRPQAHGPKSLVEPLI